MPEANKFHNLHLTRTQYQATSSLFNAIVRLSRPEYRPNYMRILGEFSPGFLRAEIAYHAFAKAQADQDVLTVELRAFQSQSLTRQ